MNDTQNEPEFRDHYYTLGIDLDASGDVVEEAYWQHIRASRLGGSEAPVRPQDIEDLNEAYRVLMTPQLRRAYDAERTDLLGADAAPRARRPDAFRPPLRVMEKQMPALRQSADVADEVVAVGWSFPIPARVLATSLALLAGVTFLVVLWLLL